MQRVERGQAVSIGAAGVIEQLTEQRRRRRTVGRVPGVRDRDELDADEAYLTVIRLVDQRLGTPRVEFAVTDQFGVGAV